MSEAFGEYGGADGDRTRDLLVANEALSQLSYSPKTPCHYSKTGPKLQ
jgi:hypothetical protein